jgi:hypothetical protein
MVFLVPCIAMGGMFGISFWNDNRRLLPCALGWGAAVGLVANAQKKMPPEVALCQTIIFAPPLILLWTGLLLRALRK